MVLVEARCAAPHARLLAAQTRARVLLGLGHEAQKAAPSHTGSVFSVPWCARRVGLMRTFQRVPRTHRFHRRTSPPDNLHTRIQLRVAKDIHGWRKVRMSVPSQLSALSVPSSTSCEESSKSGTTDISWCRNCGFRCQQCAGSDDAIRTHVERNVRCAWRCRPHRDSSTC